MNPNLTVYAMAADVERSLRERPGRPSFHVRADGHEPESHPMTVRFGLVRRLRSSLGRPWERVHRRARLGTTGTLMGVEPRRGIG